MPVFAENGHKRDAIKAAQVLRAMLTAKGTLGAVSANLAETTGKTFGKGYLSLVMHGKRPPSKELLIALGIRKARRPLTDDERARRKKRHEIGQALSRLYDVAQSGCLVSMTRHGETWRVEISNTALGKASSEDATFAHAAITACDTPFN